MTLLSNFNHSYLCATGFINCHYLALRPQKKSKTKKSKEGADKGKAEKARAVLKKGVHMKGKHRVWTSATFRRPATRTVARNPKYAKRSVAKAGTVNNYDVIQYPLISEAASGLMENQNTLVFIVKLKATKTGKSPSSCLNL